MKRFLFSLMIFLLAFLVKAQVGIGTNNPNLSSILDMVSSNQGILIPRVALTSSTDVTTIANGNVESLLVYNTAITSDITPGFYYWSLDKWNKLAKGTSNISSGVGVPMLAVPISPNQGDIYVDTANGSIYTFSSGAWGKKTGISGDTDNILTLGTDGLPYLNYSALNINANNGLTKEISTGTIQLGGALISPTTITTNTDNTLAIKGLNTGNASDEVLTINPTTKVLTQTPKSDIMQEYQVIYTATNGQIQFTTPQSYTNINKINVYRNGVRIGATTIDASTIQLESGVVCVSNDEIRIVQFN